MQQFLEIGKIVGTHGIRGEVRVELWCDSAEFFCSFKTLYLHKGKEKLSVKSRPHKNIALTQIKGTDSIEQADILRGKVLYMDRNDASLPDGVYFVQDLIGMTVRDKNSGEVYGAVTNVLKTGANDVYEVKSPDGKIYYVPKIDDIVKEIFLEEKYINIVPMKGLFDEDED